MNPSPPARQWAYVPAGSVVIWLGVPRTVLDNVPFDGGGVVAINRLVLLEGWAEPIGVHGMLDIVQLATLDDTDAVATLQAAGLNPIVINVSIEQE